MATIDNKRMIDEMIKNNGYYMDDPRIHMIVEYTNAYGNQTWGVTWSDEIPQARERYLEQTNYVRNPKVIWKANDSTNS